MLLEELAVQVLLEQKVKKEKLDHRVLLVLVELMVIKDKREIKDRLEMMVLLVEQVQKVRREKEVLVLQLGK